MTSSPAPLPSSLSDEAIHTLLRLSKLAQAAGDTNHHELMAAIVEADLNR